MGYTEAIKKFAADCAARLKEETGIEWEATVWETHDRGAGRRMTGVSFCGGIPFIILATVYCEETEFRDTPEEAVRHALDDFKRRTGKDLRKAAA